MEREDTETEDGRTRKRRTGAGRHRGVSGGREDERTRKRRTGGRDDTAVYPEDGKTGGHGDVSGAREDGGRDVSGG